MSVSAWTSDPYPQPRKRRNPQPLVAGEAVRETLRTPRSRVWSFEGQLTQVGGTLRLPSPLYKGAALLRVLDVTTQGVTSAASPNTGLLLQWHPPPGPTSAITTSRVIVQGNVIADYTGSRDDGLLTPIGGPHTQGVLARPFWVAGATTRPVQLMFPIFAPEFVLSVTWLSPTNATACQINGTVQLYENMDPATVAEFM